MSQKHTGLCVRWVFFFFFLKSARFYSRSGKKENGTVLLNTNSCFRMQTEQSFINNLTSIYKVDKNVHLMEFTYDKFIKK